MNRSKLAAALLLGTALTALSVSAQAEDEGFTAGSILIRARALGVYTESSNGPVNLLGSGAATGNLGGQIQATSAIIPELDASYFFTPNLAVEVIAGTARTALRLKDPAKTLTANTDLGNTWILPPTVTLQWHFLPTGIVNPYFGAGVNYTWFYNTEGGSVNQNNLKLRPSFGEALQAGADIRLSGNWYGNFDVKKIFLDTAAKSNTNSLVAGTQLNVKNIALNPWLIGVGIGYRF